MHLPELIHQKPYEKIVHVLRRHPITMVPAVLLLLSGIIMPIILIILTNNLFPGLLLSDAAFAITTLFMSAYAIGILIFFFTNFTDFYLDIWIVTNDRIVDIEQFGLFSRSVSETDLYQIQDVTTEVHGPFATLFHFGDVVITTASQNAGIIFRNIKNPDRVRQDIVALAHEDRKYHAHTSPVVSATSAGRP